VSKDNGMWRKTVDLAKANVLAGKRCSGTKKWV